MKRCNICNTQLLTPKKALTDIVLSCPNCHLYVFINAKITEYEDNYFLDEYKNQYQSTYFEDKKKMQDRMKWRLYLLKHNLNKQNLLHNQTKNMLEVGSSAGFFLELAQKENYNVEGWELSKFMTEYANQQGIPTIQGDVFALFEKYQNQKKFDIIAAFYVIEHLTEQNRIWEIFSSLLKPNGLLLLSTPSIFGPTFYFNLHTWIKTHPKDHFFDYAPKSIKKIAKIFQFRILTQQIEGIHPQRFWKGSSYIGKHIYTFIQKRFIFSDTLFTILQKNE